MFRSCRYLVSVFAYASEDNAQIELNEVVLHDGFSILGDQLPVPLQQLLILV